MISPHKTLTFFLLAFMCSTPAALAAAADQSGAALDGPGARQAEQASTPGSVSCFDYYQFGSVQVSVSPSLSTAAAGVPIHFSGTITNNNEYPIVDGQVYAKIFYKNQTADQKALNGYPLVDQFIALDHVNLMGRASQPVSFDWQVPSYAASGEYQIAMYFTSAYRYNLLGLTFTDDVTGNIAPFSVQNVSGFGPAYLDKNTILINNEALHPATGIRHFGKDEAVTLSTTLVNPRNETVPVTVTWELYAWDAMTPDHLKDTQTETVVLKPNERKTLSHEVAPIDSAVSYVVVRAQDHDATSLLDIRFARDGIAETRINFPSVLSYPLVAGQPETIFSCVHATNVPVVTGNTLTLALKDADGNLLHTYTYEGDITGTMMGVKDTFTPTESLSTFSLTATLTHDGKTVEEVTMRYDCDALQGTACRAEDSVSPWGSKMFGISGMWLYGLIAGLLVVAFLAGWYLLKITKKTTV